MVAAALFGAAAAGAAGLGPVGSGCIGFGAGGAAGGLLRLAIERAAERPGVGRAAGLSFLPRAALLLAAFVWARALWHADSVWIVPGFLAGEGVWVAQALAELRRHRPDPGERATAEE